jgi:hypothetical protein
MTGNALRITLWVGLLLTLVGLIDRYLIGARGGSALLPTLLGLTIALLGCMALDPQYTRRALLGVALLSVVGVLGTLPVLPELGDLLAGRSPEGSAASIIVRGAVLLLCGMQVVVSVVSLVRAGLQRAVGKR